MPALDRALLCLNLLCEGSSVRAIERITGTERRTVLNLLVQVGAGCERMLAETVKAVPVQDAQTNCGRTSTASRRRGSGGSIRSRRRRRVLLLGIERNSKLILTWHLGRWSNWDAHDSWRSWTGPRRDTSS